MVVGVLFVTAHSVGKVKQEKDATRTFCLVPAIDGGGDVAKPEVMRMQRMWMARLTKAAGLHYVMADQCNSQSDFFNR